MTKHINKTIYMNYLECAKNAWLKLNKAELQALFSLSEFEKSLSGQGHAVEQLAQQLFPMGMYIKSFDIPNMLAITRQHVQSKTPVLFQPTFVWGNFLVRNDILEYDELTSSWNLYEVKACNTSNNKKKGKKHIEDATFQYIVLKEQGLRVGKVFIISLNKDYVRHGSVNLHQLFDTKDITEGVLRGEQATRITMQEAHAVLVNEHEQNVLCKCNYSGRSAHCTTFGYSYKDVPMYSVHDIARIGNSKKKLAILIDMGIFDLNDVPDDFDLSNKQKNQVRVHKSKSVFAKHTLIEQELNALSYPLYFLDYETYASAIPPFDGFKPYQQMIFQFSLHVIVDEHSEPTHFEYLHESQSDPSLLVIHKLLELIGQKGTIIVWHEGFEKSRHVELAQRHPEYKEFLDDINNRIYDLEDIFTAQLYVHHAFKGKTSIKNVLPVLVPELTYDGLSIQEGGAASQSWYDMVYGHKSQEEQQQIVKGLKEYCKLDTYAMYKIWRFLIGMVSKT